MPIGVMKKTQRMLYITPVMLYYWISYANFRYFFYLECKCDY